MLRSAPHSCRELRCASFVDRPVLLTLAGRSFFCMLLVTNEGKADVMKQFTVSESHLKLLRQMQVGWCGDEYGAPEIDPKRPYGNSNVEGDMREILDLPEPHEDGTEDGTEGVSGLRELHEQTRTALQIALATGQFSAGEYFADDYRHNWQKLP